MLVSHKHRFLFVHIPKTGGSSIKSALKPFCWRPEEVPVNRMLSKVGINVNRFGPLAWRRGRKHATAQQIRRLFPDSVFDSYHSFAFVRNPWDLMVSYYHFIKGNERHHRSAKVREIESFKAYLEYEARRNKVSQTAFVADGKGRLLVDFAGRFETLEADFAQVCNQFDIPASLPHINTSSHKDYRSYYDDETAELVATAWAEDIHRLGYTFDGEFTDLKFEA